MRRKTVLSHLKHLFPTFPLRLVEASFLAASLVMCSAANAQSKNTDVTNDKSDKSSQSKTTQDKVNDEDTSTVVSSEQISGRPERFVHFDYNVEVLKGAMRLNANRAIYRVLDDEMEATGGVSMQRNGDCYSGDSVRLQLDTGAGYILNPAYKLLRTNAQGKADRIEFESEERSSIVNGTYSTCEGLDPDWYLKADTMKLDTGLDTGIAGKSVVYFKGVPILATPSFLPLSFPLSGARHSGLLPPVFGTSSKGGIELDLPYYFNIAPNRDLTVHPKMIQRRGLQLGFDGRYLGSTYAGETNFEGILNDRQTQTNRYALASIHNQKLLPQLDFSWNLNAASDDDYPADFSRSITKTAQRLLLRETNLAYYGSFWSATLRASNYQVLQDVTSPISRPYDRLPQLQLRGGQSDVLGFDWSIDAIFTRFWHPTLIRGDRTVFNPQLSYPILRSSYFIVPKISLHATAYNLSNQVIGQDADFRRVLPTISLDSGLVFERQAKFFGAAVTQTLEPRLFYVNTPFRDQSSFPNFDSANADFNFAQIFSENRFTGHDRIGDSNQITTALVSRFIEENGEERFKLALGQRFHFNTQRVTLDNTVSPSRSDLLLAGAGKLSNTLSAEASLQISQSDRQSIRSNYGMRWQPAAKKVLNVDYRFQRDSLKQVDLSGQWPVADRWYAVGRSNYSLRDRKLVDGLVGFEYKDDCWSFRLVGQRFATSSNTNTTAFFIQLELNGLSKLGSNPLDVLKKNISGYQPIN
jgi:LPS-assembly protein